MPFSIDDPDKLPENVQKLPDRQKRRWVEVWNSAFDACQEDDGDDCEAAAFAQANAILGDDDGEGKGKGKKKPKERKAQEDAPNYHQALGNIRCDNCRFGRDRFCNLYDFVYTDGWLCDSWTEPAAERRMAIAEYGKAGRRNSESDMKMIQGIHDSAAGLGARCKGMDRYLKDEAEQKAVDSEELDDVYQRYKALVNMSASELERWAETDCSRKASLGRGPIERNLRLLKRAKDDWTERDLADANRTISFISRMKANLGGKRIIKDDNGNECGTKAHISLKNWAYDSEKARKTIEVRRNALKAISRNDDELIVANYIALWGDPNGDFLTGGRDLEGILSPRKNKDGSNGEYFTKATQFDSDYTAADAVIVDFEHGLKPDQVGPGAEPLGRVKWKSAEIDEAGLWVKRILNRRNKYIKMLDQMGFFDNGWIGTSSQAVSAKVRKAPDGEIEVWPLERDTLTVTPMEPRNISENQLEALKTLQAEMPQLAKAIGLDTFDNLSEGDGGPSREEIKRVQTRLRLKQKLAM